ncbi:jg11015 [Pararge aegeria aegeria]|uniref:Jg11015 protein n=1 Tax=Pararge aegeria aegeria TaxID=348720 RepID=A0A8S4S8T0_9NEOP|nr:jg11015 [Pararge aegeria aegeria]
MDLNDGSTSALGHLTTEGTSSNVVIAKCTRHNNERATSTEQTTDRDSTEESDAEEFTDMFVYSWIVPARKQCRSSAAFSSRCGQRVGSAIPKPQLFSAGG